MMLRELEVAFLVPRQGELDLASRYIEGGMANGALPAVRWAVECRRLLERGADEVLVLPEGGRRECERAVIPVLNDFIGFKQAM